MRNVLQYVSALFAAIGVLATFLAILSFAPGAFADQPLTAAVCPCPSAGWCGGVNNDCYGDNCLCCYCNGQDGCEWAGYYNPNCG